MFSHSTLGWCRWDLPALIVLILILVIYGVHRHNMNQREKEFEKELSDRQEAERSV